MIANTKEKDSWIKAHYQLSYQKDVVSCLKYALNEIEKTKSQCFESYYIKDALDIVRTFKIKDDGTGQLYELTELDAEFLNQVFYLTEKFKKIQCNEGVFNYEVFSSLRIYNDAYNKEKTLNLNPKLNNERILTKEQSKGEFKLSKDEFLLMLNGRTKLSLDSFTKFQKERFEEALYKDYTEGKIKSPTEIEDVRIDFKPVVIKNLSTSYLPSFIRKIFQ